MMRVLLLTEKMSGGISEYTKRLGKHISRSGEAHIVFFDSSVFDFNDGYNAHSISLMIHGNNIFNWAMLMNNEMKRRARELFETVDFDVIHANDWITAPAAMSISKLIEKPFFLTMHSTEHQRGFMTPYSSIISDVEWWACNEAKRVIITNNWTANSLKKDLAVLDNKISLINPFENGWEIKTTDLFEIMVKK